MQARRRRRRLAAATTDPLEELIASLFGNGEAGEVYVASPVVRGSPALFQDDTGTQPAALGDLAWLMVDQSGVGGGATQPTEASKAAVGDGLEFDGSGDFYSFPEFSTTGALMMCFAVKFTDASTVGMFCGVSDLSSTSAKIGSVSGSVFARLVASGASMTAPVTSGEPHVITITRNAGGTANMRLDGSDVSTVTAAGQVRFDQMCGNDGSSPQFQFFDGSLYGAIFRDADDGVEEAEAYLSSLAGVTLS